MSRFNTFIRLFFLFMFLAGMGVLQKPPKAHAATIVVTGTGDTIAVDGFCTLREAITAANSDTASGDCPAGAGADTINFNIPGAGVHTIQPTSALPPVTGSIIIDGASQPGASCGPSRVLAIELDGTLVGASAGLTIGSNNTVRGLIINRFAVQGILVIATGNIFECNYLGTDSTGTLDLGNSIGIALQSSNNRVGTNSDGTNDAEERNVISGNGFAGVFINGNNSANNVVAGNYIGTDANGTADLGNSGDGIRINLGDTSIIGTNGDGINDAVERNIISGNDDDGIEINGTAAIGNRVAGNYIGTDVTGTTLITNGLVGVHVVGATGSFVGTNGDGSAGDAAEGNVIAGSGINGVHIETNATGNRVAGNFIGTNAAGNVRLGAGTAQGVLIHRNADNNIIGTNGDGISDALERNVVVGAGQHGIRFADTVTTGNVAAGNYVGTNATGTAALGNTLSGIAVDFSASNSRIGTNGDGVSDDLEGNLTSGNQFGISLGGVPGEGDGNTNIVAGNRIGTNAAGTAALPNTQGGIVIRGGGNNNTIGGDISAERNLISGNNGHGVLITDTNSLDNRIENNVIGTDFGNTLDLGNAAAGVAAASVVDDDALGVTISLNIIRFNAYGVNFVDAAENSRVNDNCIYDNTVGVSNSSAVAPAELLAATSNWWGDASGPGVVGPGAGDTVSADVTFSPFLNTAPAFCPAVVVVASPTPAPVAGTQVAAAPGIFITKSVDKTVAQIGDTLTYTITFTNPKGNTLNNVVIADTFDSRLSNIRVVSTTLGSTVVSGNSMSVQGFSLAPGQNGTVIVTAQISSRANPGDVISNSATLESPDASIHVSLAVTTTILPSALPSTGESPLWRLPLLLTLLIGVGLSGAVRLWRSRLFT